MLRSLLLLAAGLAAAAPAAEVTVRAARSGEGLQIEASAEFEGNIARTWQVLTDYGRLAEFIPSLRVSRVVARDRNTAEVEQKGEARMLFFSYPIDVRLAITEHPYERVVSRAVAGNFRELRSTYLLETGGGRVLLRYAGYMVPDFTIPPLIGTWVLRRNIEETFRALVAEIERQHGAEAPRAQESPLPQSGERDRVRGGE